MLLKDPAKVSKYRVTNRATHYIYIYSILAAKISRLADEPHHIDKLPKAYTVQMKLSCARIFLRELTLITFSNLELTLSV